MTDQPARPATGAESLDPRLRAYAAVFAYLQQLPAETTYLDPITRNAIIWRAVHAALHVIDPEPDAVPGWAPHRDAYAKNFPIPTALRDRYAAAIASYDHAVGQATDPAPGDHHYGQADAALAVRDRELEQLRAQVTRVRQLAERWENALTPDLAYARALRRALNPQEQP